MQVKERNSGRDADFLGGRINGLMELLKRYDLPYPACDKQALFREADLKAVGSSGILSALGNLGTDFLKGQPPDLISVSKIRAALEQGLQTGNHPLIREVSATRLAHITKTSDVATINRLRSIVADLEPSGREELEMILEYQLIDDSASPSDGSSEQNQK